MAESKQRRIELWFARIAWFAAGVALTWVVILA